MDKGSRQCKIGIVLTYITMGLQSVIQLVYTPIMIRLLGKSEYGLYTLVASIVSYLSLFSLGFSGAYMRFYSRCEVQNDAEDKIASLNGMFTIVFTIMSAMAFLCGAILAMFPRQVFGNQLLDSELQLAQVLMLILVFNISLSLPFSLTQSIVISQEKFLFQKGLELLGVILNPFICLPLLIMGKGSVAIVIVTTAITILKFLINISFCTKKLHIKISFKNLEMGLLKEIGGFSFFLFLNMIIDQVNWNVDKFIIGRIHGTGEVAIYGIGAQINALYTSLSTAVSSVFVPRVNRMVCNGEKIGTTLTSLMIRVGRVQMFVLLFIGLCFCSLGKTFVQLWAGKDFKDSYYVAMILMVSAVIPLVQNVGIEIQRAMNKHQFRSIIYLLITIVNVIISIPLCKIYGAVGSALGTALALIIGNGLIMNWYYHTKLGLNMVAFWRAFVSFLPVAIIMTIVGWGTPQLFVIATWGSLLITGCFYLVLFSIVVWLFTLQGEEKKYIQKSFKHALNILKREKNG